MRRIRKLPLLTLLAALPVVMGVCATSTVSNRSVANDEAGFKNFLVIGVANDYDGRARFERKLVADLKSEGVSASPMYVVAGGNKPIEREAVEELITTNSYDAVLISRVLS